ncbi:hypothetical protein BJ912DRAFT_1061709 [Pholiota molesta]|nr:hypothetical protein BJ912DRAFT_1061709 [Pholiota molesta]
MSAPENKPHRYSSLTEAGHTENPSLPKIPYIPLTKEQIDRILDQYRHPLNEASSSRDVAQIESVELAKFDEEPEPESDEETRRIRNKIFHLDIPDARPPGPLNNSLEQSREHTKRKIKWILNFVDAEIKKIEDVPNEENERKLAIHRRLRSHHGMEICLESLRDIEDELGVAQPPLHREHLSSTLYDAAAAVVYGLEPVPFALLAAPSLQCWRGHASSRSLSLLSESHTGNPVIDPSVVPPFNVGAGRQSLFSSHRGSDAYIVPQIPEHIPCDVEHIGAAASPSPPARIEACAIPWAEVESYRRELLELLLASESTLQALELEELLLANESTLRALELEELLPANESTLQALELEELLLANESTLRALELEELLPANESTLRALKLEELLLANESTRQALASKRVDVESSRLELLELLLASESTRRALETRWRASQRVEQQLSTHRAVTRRSEDSQRTSKFSLPSQSPRRPRRPG